jgi:hypothetical protein
MKMHARSLARVGPIAAIALAIVLGVAACKKAPEPTPTPSPQAAPRTEVTQSDSGTTTTFAPPAAEPQAPPTNAAQ